MTEQKETEGKSQGFCPWTLEAFFLAAEIAFNDQRRLMALMVQINQRLVKRQFDAAIVAIRLFQPDPVRREEAQLAVRRLERLVRATICPHVRGGTLP